MTIKKVANSYIRFLKQASAEAMSQVEKLRAASKALYLTKDLWLSAADVYEESPIENAMEKVNKNSLEYISEARNHGVSGSQAAGYYKNIQDGAQELEATKLSTHLYPSASNTLGALKEALKSMVPVSLSPTNVVVAPDSIISGGEPEEGGNAAEQGEWEPSSKDFYLKDR